MIARRTLSISLTPELHAFIGDLVRDGAYSNSSEVVRAGLRLLRREEGHRPALLTAMPTVKQPGSVKA